MSKQRFYAVGINRDKLPANLTENPDCHFDPTRVGKDDQSFDAGGWAVSAGFSTMLQAKIMATLGQRALHGAQDFFVMEHTDGVPSGYYALPRICTDDELEEATMAAIREMPEDVMRRAFRNMAETRDDEEHRGSRAQSPTPPPVQVVFIPRRSDTQQ